MQDLKIAFALKGMQEYFVKWKYTEYYLKNYRKETKENSAKFYMFEKTKPVPENMGTFLLDFLNLDLYNKDNVEKFMEELL